MPCSCKNGNKSCSIPRLPRWYSTWLTAQCFPFGKASSSCISSTSKFETPTPESCRPPSIVRAHRPSPGVGCFRANGADTSRGNRSRAARAWHHTLGRVCRPRRYEDTLSRRGTRPRADLESLRRRATPPSFPYISAVSITCNPQLSPVWSASISASRFDASSPIRTSLDEGAHLAPIR